MTWDLVKRLPAYPEVSHEEIRIYLTLLALKGAKRYAAIMAGIEPSVVKYIVKQDPELMALEQAALDDYKEQIDMEIHHRAMDGDRKAVYYKGEVVGHDLVKSDRMLELLAKARNPERYKDHLQVDANVKAGVLVVNTTLDPDDWEAEYANMRIDKSRLDRKSPQPNEAPK